VGEGGARQKEGPPKNRTELEPGKKSGRTRLKWIRRGRRRLRKAKRGGGRTLSEKLPKVRLAVKVRRGGEKGKNGHSAADRVDKGWKKEKRGGGMWVLGAGALSRGKGKNVVAVVGKCEKEKSVNVV